MGERRTEYRRDGRQAVEEMGYENAVAPGSFQRSRFSGNVVGGVREGVLDAMDEE